MPPSTEVGSKVAIAGTLNGGLGLGAALVVLPYYNRPNQEGLIAHFTALAEASALPIVVYNVPSRTVADMSVATMAP